MKEIKDIQMKHLEKYDINVKPFLTLAEIQAIANAIKPVVIAGEEMNVYLVKEGKESNQAIAYLDNKKNQDLRLSIINQIENK